MMKFKHAELEYIHDYIQWLFPSPQPSMFNSDAPLLTQEDIILFNTDPVLREHLLEAFKKILDFYGFELQEGMQGEIPTLNIVRSSDWEGAHQALQPQLS